MSTQNCEKPGVGLEPTWTRVPKGNHEEEDKWLRCFLFLVARKANKWWPLRILLGRTQDPSRKTPAPGKRSRVGNPTRTHIEKALCRRSFGSRTERLFWCQGGVLFWCSRRRRSKFRVAVLKSRPVPKRPADRQTQPKYPCQDCNGGGKHGPRSNGPTIAGRDLSA